MEKHLWIVEGIHDASLLQKFLTLKGFRLQRKASNIESYWDKLIPKTFPEHDDLLKRVTVPLFMETANCTVACLIANGEDEIKTALKAIEYSLVIEELRSLILFMDADDLTASEKVRRMQSKWTDTLFQDYMDAACFPEILNTGITQKGIFVFPDNEQKGTIEDVLLAGGAHTYPSLSNEAEQYIARVAVDKPPRVKQKNFEASQRQKMKFGVMANVFRPGKANQVSIADNDWVSNQTIEEINSHQAIHTYLEQLFN